MPAPQTSTLFAAERALRPLTYAAVATSAGVDAAALIVCGPYAPAVVVAIGCALGAAALASNLRYLAVHDGRTTFGMIPIALIGAFPAALVGSFSPNDPLRLACIASAAVLIALATFLALWFWRLWRVGHPAREVSPTAALIVLGGAIKKGRPCHTLQLRLDVAAKLWHESPTRTIVVSGGPIPSGTITEAEAMAIYLVERGVAGSSIVLEQHAKNTRENIRLSCALLDERGFAGQRCVVSSDYHLYRALRDGRSLGIELCPVAAPTPRGSVPQQWCREVLTILFGR